MRAVWLKPLSALALCVGFTTLLPSHRESYLAYIAGLAGINAIAAVALTIVNGFAGQFSLGHAGFMAIGGYCAAILTQSLGLDHTSYITDLGFVASCLAGGSAAAVAGVLVGLPSLRLRGDYLAIVTLGFGEIVRVVIENLTITGGATGLVGIAPLTGLLWIGIWLILTITVALRLRHSSHGRALQALRSDPIAAESLGIPVTRYKVIAFGISAFLAGVAGALLGHYLQLLSPKDFTWLRSVEIVAMIVLGGMGSVSGAVLGALALTLIPEALRGAQSLTAGTDMRMVIYALLLLIIMVRRPQGLLGTAELTDWWRRHHKHV